MDPLSEACDAAIGCEIHFEVLAINIARAPRDGHRVQWMSASSPLLSSPRTAASPTLLGSTLLFQNVLTHSAIPAGSPRRPHSRVRARGRRRLQARSSRPPRAGASRRGRRTAATPRRRRRRQRPRRSGCVHRRHRHETRSWKPRARIRTALPGICTAYVPAGALDRITALSSVRPRRPNTSARILDPRGPGAERAKESHRALVSVPSMAG